MNAPRPDRPHGLRLADTPPQGEQHAFILLRRARDAGDVAAMRRLQRYMRREHGWSIAAVAKRDGGRSR